uniref:Mitochondrial ribosomal protein S7 n=1 Tax=Athene cunicularia TaxID=194338 RepID=A0A663LS88_ATHCN
MYCINSENTLKKTCILVSALSLPFPGFWPRFVLLGLLTPNAMSDKDTEELEEKEVKPELENPQLARKPSAQTLEAIKRKQLEKYHKAPEDEKETIECNPYVIFHQALKNCQPIIGLSNITKGGKTYQVPVPLKDSRKRFLAMKWLITECRENKSRRMLMPEKLSLELLQAFNNEGPIIKKKHTLHKMAEANRAYAHFRW